MTELEEFQKKVEQAEEAGVTHVALPREMARRLLDSLVPPALKVGDLVQVVEGHFAGRIGKLVNIESLAQNYPYSVEFRTEGLTSASYMYFNRDNIKKV